MLRTGSLVARRQLATRCCRMRTGSSKVCTSDAAETLAASTAYQRYASTSTSQAVSPPPLQPSLTKDKKGSRKSTAEAVQERFGRIGLNANVSKQLAATHPFIEKPSPAQAAMIPAILSPTDVILRAQTGTGKSFGILLALLSKPRIVFKVKDDATGSIPGKVDPSSTGQHTNKIQAGIASIIVVPSNELAAQYLRWARELFPKSVLPSVDPIVQCLVRGGLEGPDAPTKEEEMQRLKRTPPHILVTTPGRLSDILATSAGPSFLGVTTLRTLVLDEADAVLQLPGRFPSAKQRWNHEVHKSPGLDVLNYFMRHRATFSGGDKHLSAGLENRSGRQNDERLPPEHIRRNAYKAAEKRSVSNSYLATPLPRVNGVHPLQLVCTSATANSVLRHFLAARTGWLRPGAKEGLRSSETQLGRWIDLTGLSGRSLVDQGIRGLFGSKSTTQSDEMVENSLSAANTTIPATIQHTCVVVDEAPLSLRLKRAPLRNFSPSLARFRPPQHSASADSSEELQPKLEDLLHVIKPESEPAEHEVDQTLVEALAFTFASEGIHRGLALIPARWSLLKTRAALEALGVSVRLGFDTGSASAGEQPGLFLLQTTSARGLDIRSLSHVFLVGIHAVLDTVQYVHAAGRVSRMGTQLDQQRDVGKVVTLLRGIPHNTELPSLESVRNDAVLGEAEDSLPRGKRFVSASELKMANIFRRLRITPTKLSLDLLSADKSAEAATTAPSKDLQESQIAAQDTLGDGGVLQESSEHLPGDLVGQAHA